MAVTASTPLDAGAGEPGGTPPRASRPLLRQVHRRVPNGVWYALATLGFAIVVVLVQLALYVRRAEPRDARAIVRRELETNVLARGERVVRAVPVYRRAAVDYFRATRGLLVLTDRRLLYLGAPPRDITGASDGPPTFDQREFRIDTAVTVDGSFTILGFSRALVIGTPNGDLKVGVRSEGWPEARALRQDWENRHRQLAAIGAWGERVREARAELGRLLEEYRRQPVYHVVRPGDAISSIASWYEVPVDSIARLNGIVNNRIRIGQRLLIRSGSGRGKSG